MVRAYPRVVPVGETIEITFRSDVPLFGPGDWYVLFTPCEKFVNAKDSVQTEVISDFPISHTTNRPIRLPLCGNDLFSRTVRIVCPEEQEYIFRFFSPGMPTPVQHAEIYAVETDLQGLYPFKGDFHLHSTFSDGQDEPRRMAQACRRKGFDFMALTDHGKFAPSVSLQQTFADMPDLAMGIFTGEEIHLPYHQAHILNIGGTKSVNAMFIHNRDGFFAEIKDLQAKTEVPPTVDPYTYCSALWAFSRIKEVGGMSIFCHPYWRRPSGYELASDFTEALLQARPFDVLELISGYPQSDADSNLLQLARYYSLQDKPPIVGVSDGHTASPTSEAGGEEMFGAFYTMLLAKSNTFADVQAAILSMRSVAVDHVCPEQCRIYGPYRMVKYFQFLQRTFFWEHDRIAQKEAASMELWGIQNVNGCKPIMDGLYHAVFAW